MLQLELLELRKQQQEMEQFIKDEQRSDRDSRYTLRHRLSCLYSTAGVRLGDSHHERIHLLILLCFTFVSKPHEKIKTNKKKVIQSCVFYI